MEYTTPATSRISGADRSCLPAFEHTGAAVHATLRPVFHVRQVPADRVALAAYGRACGADVAAWERQHALPLLSEAEAAQEGASLAEMTLLWELCSTDDRAAFLQHYQAAYLVGYFGTEDEAD